MFLAGSKKGFSPESLSRLKELVAGQTVLADMVFDERSHYQNDRTFFVQQERWIGGRLNRSTGVAMDADSGVCLVGWIRLDNYHELKKLSLDGDRVDAEICLAAYLKWGEGFCEHLRGDFALALYDPRHEKWLLCRDQIGARPLYYYWDGQKFLTATSIAVFFQLPELKLNVEQNWVTRYVAGCSADERLTPYGSIEKVPAGTISLFTRDQIKSVRYFEFPLVSSATESFSRDYADEYYEALWAAVSSRTNSPYPLGAEISGGLDSSSVMSIASRCATEPEDRLHGFAFLIEKKDRHYLDIAGADVTHAKTHIVDRLRDSNARRSAHQRFFKHAGVPCQHENAVGHVPIYNLAKSLGVRTLLSGFGGDEFVTCYGDFARADLLHERRFLTLVSRFSGSWPMASLRALKWALTYPQRVNDFRRRLEQGLRSRLEHSLIVSDQSRQSGVDELMMTGFTHRPATHSLNQHCVWDRWGNSQRARLEDCTLMTAAWGIEYAWPLLDSRLIETFLSIPAEQKFGPGGLSRYLHRRAVAGILPKELVWKDKSMGGRITGDPGVDKPQHLDFAQLHPMLQAIVDRERYTATSNGSTTGRTLRVGLRQAARIQIANDWLGDR